MKQTTNRVTGLFVLTLATCAAAQKPIVVSFKATDSVQLEADYFPAAEEKAPAVILLHMFKSDRSAWAPLVPHLHEAGFAVLAVDMRGHGNSLKPDKFQLRERAFNRDPSLFNSMYWDVEAAYAFLANEPGVDMTRVGLVGASIGTSVAIMAASKNPAIDAVVCMTAGDNYLGVPSVDHIKQCKGQPILLMTREDERRATDILAKLNTDAKARIYPGERAHGTRMFGKVEGVEEDIVAYLERHLGGPADKPVVAHYGKKSFVPANSESHKAMRSDRVIWFSSADEATRRGLKPASE